MRNLAAIAILLCAACSDDNATSPKPTTPRTSEVKPPQIPRPRVAPNASATDAEAARAVTAWFRTENGKETKNKLPDKVLEPMVAAIETLARTWPPETRDCLVAAASPDPFDCFDDAQRTQIKDELQTVLAEIVFAPGAGAGGTPTPTDKPWVPVGGR